MAEQPFVLSPSLADLLSLELGVAARDASGVPLGRVHVHSPLLERRHSYGWPFLAVLGATLRDSLRSHRIFSVVDAEFTLAYHLITE